ncbi:hypothetical protein JCM8202_003648 [Rhodotorula sphaerocarpa]
MDRPHALLDRLEAAAPRSAPPSLKETALTLLRLHWPAVRDLGDAPFSLVQDLLPHSSAAQLAALEDNSPHIQPFTNGIWRRICVNEFIEVRKAVEDGRLSERDEPTSWREQYHLEEVRREEKMQAIVSRMRGQIDGYKNGRATTKQVDWRLEKKRKSASTAAARPKTLMEKARHNSKAIQSIYAPRRRPVPPAKAAVVPIPPPSALKAKKPPPTADLAAPRKRPLTDESDDSISSPRKKSLITTTKTTVSVPKPASPAPPASSSVPSRPLPSPAPTSIASRPVVPPPRRPSAVSLPKAKAPPPPPPPAPPPRLSVDPCASLTHEGTSAGAARSPPPPPRPVVPRGIFMPKRR